MREYRDVPCAKAGASRGRLDRASVLKRAGSALAKGSSESELTETVREERLG